ncbi:MAG: hypothetical protein KDD69_06880 [Bdellovibrionales bacterium]|nr:hypothetical protein [Bdellovibrionales bacterium]
MAIKVRRGKLYPPVEPEQAFALGLDEVEWDKIVDRLGRPPNQFECHIFATLWSEAVSNKSSAALLQAIDSAHAEVKTIPGSKVGLIDIGKGTMLALRIVSNNKPTYLEPFYGAQTAMDGALEELTTVGARPLGLLNMLRFGNYDFIRNQRLFQGVVDGISAFGMKYGVPIVGGELYFHDRYNGEAMVNSGVVGVLHSTNALQVKEVAYNSPVLYVGARTGLDGLKHHSAEGEAILSGEKIERETLKISDPLLANRLVNACAEAIEAGVLTELVAVGHGGLAVACFDLSSRINRPVLLDIDRVPLRVDSMEPLDIILSESSERVLMITEKKKHRDLNRILHKWDLESVKVGEVNDADGIEFYWNHYQAADIPFLFAVEGAEKKSYEVVQFPPMLKRSAKTDDADKIRRRKRKVEDEWSLIREVALSKEQDDEEREIDCPKDLEDTWLDLMANPNLCSRSSMYRLFDQVVGANTVQRPGGDAAILRLRRFEAAGVKVDLDELEDQLHDGPPNGTNGHGREPERAIAVTLDSNSLYVSMEPYLGTVQTIAEGMRNLAAVGAVPVGLAYCMNFGNPESYKDVCDLAESIRGLGDAAKIWNIPILSKQITLGHGSEANPILPTPAILMAGLIDDLQQTCTIGFKSKGDSILLLGLTENEIGCSEYASYSHKFVNRLVPDIDFEKERAVCELIVRLIRRGLLRSAHDLSGGGLAAALTESCMARTRPIGCVFHIDDQVFETPNGPVPLRRDAALFSETSGRFLISCSARHEEQIARLCDEAGVPITGRGKVGGKMIQVEGAAEVELPVSTTYKLWVHRLESLLGMGGEETTGFGVGA